MAKTKQKKKYTPRPLSFPGMIIASNAFGPIEKAISHLLAKGELLEDVVGNYVYETCNGKLESYEASIEIYTETCERLFAVLKPGLPCEFPALLKLKQTMLDKEGFDEEDIDAARAEMKKCRQILSLSNSMVIREVALAIGDKRIKEGKGGRHDTNKRSFRPSTE